MWRTEENVGRKKNWGQKKLEPKSLFGPKQNFKSENFVGKKKYKRIWSKKIRGQKKHWGEKNFWKKNVGQKIYVRNFVG